jgi:hypothetical protein
MKEFKPIVDEVKLGPMTVRHRLPPKGGLATVVEARGGYTTFEPHSPPKIGDLKIGGYKRLYRVDISPFSVALKFDLPSRGDAWQFHASAVLTVSVSDPATVVRLRMVDASVVESLIMRELRKRSRGFDIVDIEKAEEKLNEYLHDQVFDEVGFKIRYGWITLGVDDSEIQYFQHDIRLQRDKERAAGREELERQQADFAAARNQQETEHRQRLDRLQAAHELMLERLRADSTLQLEREREQHRRTLERERIAIYQDAIRMDVPGLLLLRLATHPEDADAVIKILASQEREKLNVHLEFFRDMLHREEVVHAWQLEEPVLKMLRRLVEVFTLSSERAIGEGPEAPIAVERGAAIKVEASLIDPKDTGAEPGPGGTAGSEGDPGSEDGTRGEGGTESDGDSGNGAARGR